MKKTIALLSLMVGLATVASADAGRSTGKFAVPTDKNGLAAPSVQFFGVAVDTAAADGTVVPNLQGAQTGAKLWFSGEGVFYDVLASTGAATEVVFCYDAATASNTNFEDSTISLVAVASRTTTATVSARPGYAGLVPVRIRKGLVCDSTDDKPYIPLFEPK